MWKSKRLRRRRKAKKEKYTKQLKYAPKQMELANKEGLAHQLKFAALHQIQEKLDKVRKQTKNHEKALINIQRIEEMLGKITITIK